MTIEQYFDSKEAEISEVGIVLVKKASCSLMLFSPQVSEASLRPVAKAEDLFARLTGVELGFSVSKKDSEGRKWCKAAESRAARSSAGISILVLQAI